MHKILEYVCGNFAHSVKRALRGQALMLDKKAWGMFDVPVNPKGFHTKDVQMQSTGVPLDQTRCVMPLRTLFCAQGHSNAGRGKSFPHSVAYNCINCICYSQTFIQTKGLSPNPENSRSSLSFLHHTLLLTGCISLGCSVLTSVTLIFIHQTARQ